MGAPALGSTISANNSTAVKVLSFQRNNATTGSSDHWPAAGTDLSGIAPPPLSGTNVTYWLDVPSGELRSLVPGGSYRVAARSVVTFTVSCGGGSVNGSGNGLSTSQRVAHRPGDQSGAGAGQSAPALWHVAPPSQDCCSIG